MRTDLGGLGATPGVYKKRGALGFNFTKRGGVGGGVIGLVFLGSKFVFGGAWAKGGGLNWPRGP